MISHLRKVVTGEISRRNSIDRLLLTYPLKRAKDSKLFDNIFLRQCSFCIYLQVQTGVHYLLFDSNFKGYKELGRKIDEGRIEDLASFLAWHSCWRALSFFAEDVSFGENFKFLEKELSDLTNIMYPMSEKVHSLKDKFSAVEFDGDSMSYLSARYAIIDECAQVVSPVEFSDIVERSLMMSPVLGSWEDFAEVLSKQSETGESYFSV